MALELGLISAEHFAIHKEHSYILYYLVVSKPVKK